jgi:hypothetical protein
MSETHHLHPEAKRGLHPAIVYRPPSPPAPPPEEPIDREYHDRLEVEWKHMIKGKLAKREIARRAGIDRLAISKMKHAIDHLTRGHASTLTWQEARAEWVRPTASDGKSQ